MKLDNLHWKMIIENKIIVIFLIPFLFFQRQHLHIVWQENVSSFSSSCSQSRNDVYTGPNIHTFTGE